MEAKIFVAGDNNCASAREPMNLNQILATGFSTEFNDKKAVMNSLSGGSEGQWSIGGGDFSLGSFVAPTSIPQYRKRPNPGEVFPSPVKVDLGLKKLKFDGKSTDLSENTNTEVHEKMSQDVKKKDPQIAGHKGSVIKSPEEAERCGLVRDSVMQLEAQKQELSFKLGQMLEESGRRRKDMLASLEQVAREGERYSTQLQDVKQQYKAKIDQFASFFSCNN